MEELLFQPDWTSTWTAKQAEKELENFKFSGPGWYITDKDVILVIPWNRGIADVWRQEREYLVDERFRFHIYGGRNPAAIFNAIVNAPTRQDSRA